MRLTDRPQLQYAALLVLAAGGLFCAFGLRENGLMIAGYIGLAAACVLIVIGAALTRHDRATWEPPQINPGPALHGRILRGRDRLFHRRVHP